MTKVSAKAFAAFLEERAAKKDGAGRKIMQ